MMFVSFFFFSSSKLLVFGKKEENMERLNEFMTENRPLLDKFYEKLSVKFTYNFNNLSLV